MNEYRIRKAKISDAKFLAKFASSTFFETYVAINPENKDLLRAYVTDTFSEEKITMEIQKDTVTFYISEYQNEKVGYAKTVAGTGPKELNFTPSLEIEKLYVNESIKGKGLGKLLLNHIKIEAMKAGNKSLWLSVYDHNTAAIEFYLKMGFKKIGEKDFLFNWNGKEYKDRDWLVEFSL